MHINKPPQKTEKPAIKQEIGPERKIVRIADTDLDGSEKLSDSLRKIYGISFAYASGIINVMGIQGSTKLQDLDNAALEKLKDVLFNPQKYGMPRWLYNWRRDQATGSDKHILGNELKSKLTLHIQMIKNSRSYRGYRHSFNYKLRGQRVKSRGANFKGRIGTSLGVTKKTAVQQTAQAGAETKK